MAKYRFLPDDAGVFDTEEQITIPRDPNSRFWRDYLTWLYAGNQADPAIESTLPRPYVSKLSIYEKLSDLELEQVFTARESWPLRMRLLWDDAPNNMVSPDDETLIDFLDQVLGEARRIEVLG